MTDSVAQHCKKCNGGEPLGPVLVQTNLSRARCLSSWSHIGWWRHLIRGSTLCRSRGGNGEVSLTMAAMWSGRDPQQPPSALTNPSSANGLTSVNGKETVSYEMSDFFCIRGTWGNPADICDYELASRIQLQIGRPDMHWRGNRVCDSITAVLFAETVYCMSDVQSRGWRSTQATHKRSIAGITVRKPSACFGKSMSSPSAIALARAAAKLSSRAGHYSRCGTAAKLLWRPHSILEERPQPPRYRDKKNRNLTLLLRSLLAGTILYLQFGSRWLVAKILAVSLSRARVQAHQTHFDR